MLGGKSPGVTILWLWTIGTAAVLVTNVVRTRVRDMENLLNNDDNNNNNTSTNHHQPSPSDPILIEDGDSSS